MNAKKQRRKLKKAIVAAELCITRDQAQKIIAKADKASSKLNASIIQPAKINND